MKSSGGLFAVFSLGVFCYPSGLVNYQLCSVLGSVTGLCCRLSKRKNRSRPSPLNRVFSPFLLYWLLNSATVSLSKTLNHANTGNEFVPGVELHCLTCGAIFSLFPYPLFQLTPSRGRSRIAVLLSSLT